MPENNDTTSPIRKACKTCGQLKELWEFAVGVGGVYDRRAHCKVCSSKKDGGNYTPQPPIPEGFRRCAHCKEVFPATVEFFYAARCSKKNPSGLQAYCKPCCSIRHSDYRDTNRDQIAQYKRDWYLETRPIRLAVRRKGREKRLEQEIAYAKKYNLRNRDKNIAASRLYREQHPEYFRNWGIKNRVRLALRTQKRRARVRSLPYSFSEADYRSMMEYWDNRCAYCGKQQGLWQWSRLSLDHIIPINSPECPGTIPGNIIPACGACNSSKVDKNLEDWLRVKFGQRNVKRILSKIEAYRASINRKD